MCFQGICFYSDGAGMFAAVNHTEEVVISRPTATSSTSFEDEGYGHPAIVVYRGHDADGVPYPTTYLCFNHADLRREGLALIQPVMLQEHCERLYALAALIWRERRAA